jgi:hypothetical protein
VVETRDPRESRERKAPLVLKAHRAFRVSPARKAGREPKDHRGRRVRPVTRARRVTRGRRATKVTRETPARATKATVARRVIPAWPSVLFKLMVR